MPKHTLTVEIRARSKASVADMIEALARAACDIANSYDGVRIIVRDAPAKAGQ